MSEGDQDLPRKSSDCKFYVVSNRNIEYENHHGSTILNIICLMIDDIRNSSCQADTSLS